MKLTFEIETTEDAQRAQKVLSAFIGDETVTTVSEPEAVAEKPKRKTTKKKEVEKPVEEKVEEPEESEAEKEVEPEPEAEVKDETGPATDETEMDLKTLTAIAKDAVANSDRATVKSIISEFGEKLSAVDESDYAELAKKLKAI